MVYFNDGLLCYRVKDKNVLYRDVNLFLVYVRLKTYCWYIVCVKKVIYKNIYICFYVYIIFLEDYEKFLISLFRRWIGRFLDMGGFCLLYWMFFVIFWILRYKNEFIYIGICEGKGFKFGDVMGKFVSLILEFRVLFLFC